MTRIALFQSNTGIDPTANASALEDAIRQAAEGDAEMLFTPEMSGILDRDSGRAAKNLCTEDEDKVLAACREAAKRHNIWLHIGSLAVLVGGGKVANRGFVIDREGNIRARYDKLHLFDVDLPTGESWRESNVYSAGEGVVLVNGTPIGKLGLTICYDLRFPGLFARLAEADADVISVPAAFTVPTGRAHWHVLLRARAIEAGLFVVAAAQVGRHEDGRQTFGHSLVIDPWGEVLLDMGEDKGVRFADIDLARISDVRSRIPALNHRRPIPDAVTL
ncbi:MAG: carbon-nitrogen hydrolase family protein [Myxococcales bacterium]|jgi:predicted amidohydrolase|nr:carbon-nitrogen hydrolase family protein [Sphingomicrobium sp.]